jgi:hypothetical protein
VGVRALKREGGCTNGGEGADMMGSLRSRRIQWVHSSSGAAGFKLFEMLRAESAERQHSAAQQNTHLEGAGHPPPCGGPCIARGLTGPAAREGCLRATPVMERSLWTLGPATGGQG